MNIPVVVIRLLAILIASQYTDAFPVFRETEQAEKVLTNEPWNLDEIAKILEDYEDFPANEDTGDRSKSASPLDIQDIHSEDSSYGMMSENGSFGVPEGNSNSVMSDEAFLTNKLLRALDASVAGLN